MEDKNLATVTNNQESAHLNDEVYNLFNGNLNNDRVEESTIAKDGVKMDVPSDLEGESNEYYDEDSDSEVKTKETDSDDDIEDEDSYESEAKKHLDRAREKIKKIENDLSTRGRENANIRSGLKKYVENGSVPKEVYDEIFKASNDEIMASEELNRQFQEELDRAQKYSSDDKITDYFQAYNEVIGILSEKEKRFYEERIEEAESKGGLPGAIKEIANIGKENYEIFEKMKKHGSPLQMIKNYKKKIELLKSEIDNNKKRMLKSGIEIDKPRESKIKSRGNNYFNQNEQKAHDDYDFWNYQG